MKKMIYIVLAIIIIVGAVIIGTMGLEADITYRKNIRIDVYLGKEFDNNDIRLIAKGIFKDDDISVQQIELFGDMVSITVGQEHKEDIDSLVEALKSALEEKYDIEIGESDMQVVYNPKVRLSSIITPYIIPVGIATMIILIYVAIMYRKLGVLKVLGNYIIWLLASELTFLSIFAIARIPINRLVIPFGLLIYVVVVTILTAINEKKRKNILVQESK